VKFVVLGSGTCVPTKRRGAPGYALFLNDEWLLIDGGGGTLYRLPLAQIDYRSIDNVFYTHSHPDHTGDLESFLFALNYTPGFTRTKNLRIFGPPGFSDFFVRLQNVYPWIHPTTYSCDVIEMSKGRFQLGNAVVQSRLVEHSSKVESVAYRFSNNERSVVFSGDTAFCKAIVELADNADLLVIEASVPFEKQEVPNHLTATQAGRIASLARVKNVVLTHFYPVCDHYDMKALCAKEFGGNITLAEDLMEISLLEAGITVRQVS
jgi:ribonuclease BN (tRNA processing enzyme)